MVALSEFELRDEFFLFIVQNSLVEDRFNKGWRKHSRMFGFMIVMEQRSDRNIVQFRSPSNALSSFFFNSLTASMICD